MKQRRAKQAVKPLWRRIMRVVLMVLTVGVSLGLIASAYAGTMSPESTRGYSGIVQMTMPIWLAALGILEIIDLMLNRRAAVVGAIALLTCAGPVFDFMPLRLPPGSLSDDERDRAFTLLTFNVQNFEVEADWMAEHPDATDYNATMEYILQTDADIVCVQENDTVTSNPKPPITDEQRRRMHQQYAYVISSPYSQLLMSKYPVEALRLDFPNAGGGLGQIAAYRLTIKGRKVTLFNVHLQSIGLTPNDKHLYRELTDLKAADSLHEVRTRLLSKLASANIRRAEQIEDLVRYLQNLGGPNVIIAGDFNDVPGSYTIRRLADAGMKQVYPKVGFGPMITFHADRFYFRIDHVLYRGDLHPVRLDRCSEGMSDHYPLLTTFVFDSKD